MKLQQRYVVLLAMLVSALVTVNIFLTLSDRQTIIGAVQVRASFGISKPPVDLSKPPFDFS